MVGLEWVQRTGSDNVFRRLKSTLQAVAAGHSLRRVFVAALVFVFALQAQVAATHFHFAGSGAPAQLADSGKDVSSKNQKKTPADEDQCPICQQLANAHSFLVQATACLALPELVAAQALVVRETFAAVPSIALGWQSRAPPL